MQFLSLCLLLLLSVTASVPHPGCSAYGYKDSNGAVWFRGCPSLRCKPGFDCQSSQAGNTVWCACPADPGQIRCEARIKVGPSLDVVGFSCVNKNCRAARCHVTATGPLPTQSEFWFCDCR